MSHETYESALTRGERVGASRADDVALMALLCNAPLQSLCGAVSPQLVWEGAMATGVTSGDLARMAAKDPAAVEELMWI